MRAKKCACVCVNERERERKHVCVSSLLKITLVIVSHCCRFVAAPCLSLFTEERQKISNCIFSLVFNHYSYFKLFSFEGQETVLLFLRHLNPFCSIILKIPLVDTSSGIKFLPLCLSSIYPECTQF